MIKNENIASKRIYIVVTVSRGVSENTHGFKHHKDALRYLKQLKKERNLDEDDVQIFENEIVN